MEKQRTLDEVNAMMAELGMDPSMSDFSTAPVQQPRAGVSSGPGRGGISSGPGLRAQNQVSSGPGARASGVNNGSGASGGFRASSNGGMDVVDYRASSVPGGYSQGGGGTMSSESYSSSNGGGVRASNGPGRPGGQQLATHTPDGRPVTFTGPPCAFCNEMVIGPVINALGVSWHPDHFTCEKCKKPFKGGIYVENEGLAYCEDDFNELFEAKCPECNKPVVDKGIKACGKTYHPDHFACYDCGSALKGKAFREWENHPYCMVCMQARTILIDPAKNICGKCKKPIVGEYLIVFGQYMHPEHFRCQECHCEMKAGNCHEYEGMLYCYPCYLKMLKSICALCEKPIIGRSISGMGRNWHPEHFCCAECKAPFPGGNFWEREGKPYCELHYKVLFAKVCHGCCKAIVTDGIAALGNHYHKDCFICAGCYHPLGKDIVDVEGKVYCTKCYGNLPREVRKRVDKKKDGAVKAQRDREKQARKELKKMPTH